jgi:hypothetical protein
MSNSEKDQFLHLLTKMGIEFDEYCELDSPRVEIGHTEFIFDKEGKYVELYADNGLSYYTKRI